MDIRINYIHPFLHIGMADVKNVWLLEPAPVKLSVAVHQGNLVYRLPISGNRISYRTLKKGLVKRTLIIKQPLYPLPF